ncbi:MAG: ABC transporter ATP-binding protein [Oscillospiraceae bacterium]|nr:ABC transporter ATP-binding protein [Oscillospiraceae bacterium]
MIELNDIILKVENLTKVYHNGVVANKGVSVDFRRGEIHSVVGENGAGKSTLMKIIFGIENASDGKITYKDKEVHFQSSLDAIKAGIGMVHQHFMLIPSMTVAQNIILGAEPTKSRVFIDYKEAVKKTSELAQKYNFDIDVTKKVSELSVGTKQKVEILKTLYRNAEVIILDEPTSVLTPQETESLFEELGKFRQLGHTIIFISHKLGEVKKISDRITVMRSGVSKGTYNNSDLSLEQLTELIIGRDLAQDYDDRKRQTDGKQVLRVEGLTIKGRSKNKLDGVSFSVRHGEILGIAGVEGNGQPELIKAITGLMPFDEGRIRLEDTDIGKYSIHDKRRAGLAFIPEDRMTDGAALNATLAENLVATYFDREDINKKLFMDSQKIDETAKGLIEKFSIKAESPAAKAGSLSGGNIQKAVVARESNTRPVCLIAEQPTHGIDIGSAEFVHQQLIEMRNEGAGILLVSADLDEVMSLSDRILVMYGGSVVAYFPSLKGLSRNELGLYMLGVKRQTPEELGGALDEA